MNQQVQQYEPTGAPPLRIEDLPDPEAVVKFQTRAANALMAVIDQQKGARNPFVVAIGDRKFLTFESWQTIAKFNGCHVELEGEIVPVRDDDGKLVAYGCTVGVHDNATGAQQSRAYMECGLESFPTQGKQGREKHKAAMSAAQTWAGAKACRMAFSFVAVLAGYEAVTAEEIQSSGGKDEVLCPLHGQPFFQTERMKSPAHRQGEGWCNFRPALFNEQVKLVADAVGWTSNQVNEYCKEQFGRTWSQLHMGEVRNTLDFLTELAEESPEQPSIAEDEGSVSSAAETAPYDADDASVAGSDE